MMNGDGSSLTGFGQRIAVIGTTGSGKTTLACQLALYMGVPHIELDSLHWGPNWTETPLGIFRAQVSEALASVAWTVDGNYSKVRDIVWERADTVIWLDYSLAIILVRLFKRTLRRVITREVLWNGNHENWGNAFFGRESLFLWALKTHGKHRTEYPLLLAQPQYAHLRLIRLDSPQTASQWLAQIAPPFQEKVITIDSYDGSQDIPEI